MGFLSVIADAVSLGPVGDKVEELVETVTDTVKDAVDVGAGGDSENNEENDQQGDGNTAGNADQDDGVVDWMFNVARDTQGELNENMKYYVDAAGQAGKTVVDGVSGAAEAGGDAGEAVQSSGDVVEEIPFVGPPIGAILDTVGTVLSLPDKALNGSDGSSTEEDTSEPEKGQDNDPPLAEAVSKMPDSDQSDEEASNDDEIEIVEPALLDDPGYAGTSATGDEFSVSDAEFASFLATEELSSGSQQPGAGDSLVTSTVGETPAMLSLQGDASPLMLESEPSDATVNFEMSYFG